jgi:hypothetical protein
MRRFLAVLVVFLAAAAFGRAPAGAQNAPVVLTVTGRIAAQPAPRDFTLAGLEALGVHSLRTTTPWTDGVQEFTGVRLRDLLAAVGAQGGTLAMTALNDYTVEIPAADAHAYDVIVAFRRNGRAMPVRDKGPLWIIYPLDQHAELRDAEYQARMIWQLRRIDVR